MIVRAAVSAPPIFCSRLNALDRWNRTLRTVA
jgi:hypothetical protein